MNKTKLYTALISLTFSLNAFAIGLGDMKVLSSLDQPFDAEISLIDVGDIPLSGIKANIADTDEYERAGLERSFELNTLTFVIEHNRHGHAVIHLRSLERISNPFIQLLVDLAWSKGQIYRAYDVLLDPPDYQLSFKKEIQTPPHRIKHKKQKLTPENPVTNGDRPTPTALPASQSDVTIESHLPSAPVFAQARPGKFSKQYLSASQDSQMPMQPNASHLEGINTALKAQMDVTVQAIDSLRESNALLKEELHSMHDQNQTLQGKLKQRDTEMKHMHAQIELLMRRQGLAGQVIQPSDDTQHSSWLLWLLILLGAAAGGTYVAWRRWGAPDVEKAYLFVQSRMKPKVKVKEEGSESATFVETEVVSDPAIVITESAPMSSVESSVDHEVVVEKEEVGAVDESAEPAIVTTESAPMSSVESAVDHEVVAEKEEIAAGDESVEPVMVIEESSPMLFVEPIVDHEVIAKEEQIEVAPSLDDSNEPDVKNVVDTTKSSSEKSSEEEVPTHNLIEFESVSPPEEEPLKPVRSESALDTLLTLTQTYIDMGDTAAAHESLKEVLEYGNKKQQAAAKKLMKQLDNK